MKIDFWTLHVLCSTLSLNTHGCRGMAISCLGAVLVPCPQPGQCSAASQVSLPRSCSTYKGPQEKAVLPLRFVSAGTHPLSLSSVGLVCGEQPITLLSLC